MTAAPDLTGRGTPETAWGPWLSRQDLPELDLAPLRHVVVAMAHPDDAVLAAGGLLARLAAAGATVDVVTATDGEAAYPHDPWPGLASVRRAEDAEGYRRLGPVAGRQVRLGLPDGGLGGSAGHEDALAEALAALGGPGAVLLALWSRDGHPDHDAVGRAGLRAAAATGARLLALPLWAWHWARPGDDRVPWEEALRVPLPPDAQARKAAAVAAHASQTEPPGRTPVLPPHVLDRLLRPYEVVFG